MRPPTTTSSWLSSGGWARLSEEILGAADTVGFSTSALTCRGHTWLPAGGPTRKVGRPQANTARDSSQGLSPIHVPDFNQLTIDLALLATYSSYEFRMEPSDTGEDPLSESNHVALLPSDMLFHFPLVHPSWRTARPSPARQRHLHVSLASFDTRSTLFRATLRPSSGWAQDAGSKLFVTTVAPFALALRGLLARRGLPFRARLGKRYCPRSPVRFAPSAVLW